VLPIAAHEHLHHASRVTDSRNQLADSPPLPSPLANLTSLTTPTDADTPAAVRRFLKGRASKELKDPSAVAKAFTVLGGDLAVWVATEVAATDNTGHPVVVGMVMLQTRKDVSPTALELKHLCVAPTHRRCGAGRRLVAEAVQWATTRGCTTISLSTIHSMVAAQALYVAFAFLLEGRFSSRDV
jgi:ribosomal protein S18 acetylase RimI-like enzyme